MIKLRTVQLRGTVTEPNEHQKRSRAEEDRDRTADVRDVETDARDAAATDREVDTEAVLAAADERDERADGRDFAANRRDMATNLKACLDNVDDIDAFDAPNQRGSRPTTLSRRSSCLKEGPSPTWQHASRLQPTRRCHQSTHHQRRRRVGRSGERPDQAERA
jgi:hypothetical protein